MKRKFSVRVNPNGFWYMFRFWPHYLRHDGVTFAYSWLGFWWGREPTQYFWDQWADLHENAHEDDWA